ncbi:hypothetical protein LEP1GSC082_3510 [Leptospira kirschneri str. H2]|uniref:Uncharacterized protein n=1 Tax=Leptospira kirschneri str. H1 TaxID=1049966 RepID=A0A0E2B4K5_9LEPT|nr:hypothetical protein LEP1GSC081_3260 [Leptospira kirschneri str. H1]EKO60564.1 hypothetical protein LEP1GSC082_3510 [Leptospira kirschneri str. H2]
MFYKTIEFLKLPEEKNFIKSMYEIKFLFKVIIRTYKM